MTRRIALSMLALLVAICLWLSLIAAAGVVVLITQSGPVPAEVVPAQ